MRFKLLAFAIPAFIALVIAGIFAFGSQSSPPPKLFELEMVEYAFHGQGYNGSTGGPELRVHLGDTVIIQLKNKGSQTHSFMITTVDELNKALDYAREKEAGMTGEMEMPEMAFAPMANVNGGDVQTVQFKANEAGTFFYGSFSENPELDAMQSMYGKLVVEG